MASYNNQAGQIKRLRDLIKRQVENATSKRTGIDAVKAMSFKLRSPPSVGGGSGGGGGAPGGGGAATYPLIEHLLIPDNSTADLVPLPTADCGTIFIRAGWKRGAEQGVAFLQAQHDGAVAAVDLATLWGDGSAAGFDRPNFAAVISGANLTLTLAADASSTDDLELWMIVDAAPSF